MFLKKFVKPIIILILSVSLFYSFNFIEDKKNASANIDN